jgi:hypothetical protein
VHCLVGVDESDGGGFLADAVDAAVLGGCARVSEIELVNDVGRILDKFACWRGDLVVSSRA